ncbi:hypothetical protein K1719_036876 [Acacia pycnantha]|nr:hypothetical protein K1719_036876 [Acacia pycnantha]
MAFNVIENAAPASHRSFTVNYDSTSISVTLANTAAAVGRWISETKSLQVQFPGKFVDPLDMRKYVKTDDGESLRTATIERIVEEYFGISGVPISREINMSHWGNEYLRDEQVLQVTLDAHFAFVIGKNIGAWAFN